MKFTAAAEHYDRFMGRYTTSLATAMCDAAGVREGTRVLDVGCGPGGLTAELAARIGAANVAAVDPTPQFVEACRERVPGADVREGESEALPWDDATFDTALACLVVAFMSDPAQGLREMARVTRPGGTVAACMWDIEQGGMTMLRTFWDAMRKVRPEAENEMRRAGTAEGDIAARLATAGLKDVEAGSLTARTDYTGFDDFWEPFTHGVGPSGMALAALAPEEQEAVRLTCRATLPDGPFTLDARAWYAHGTVAQVH
jgi:ubiquinone/menaquinone biosynthesis C-methylase UbiE